MQVDAIIYDFDNTLVQSEDFFRTRFWKILRKLGLCGLTTEAQLEALHADNGPFEDKFTKLVGKHASEVFAAYTEGAEEDLYLPVGGGPEVYCSFQEQGIYQGVLTNRSRLVDHRAQQAGYPAFSFVFTPPSKELRKPNPASYDPVLQHLLQERGFVLENILSVGDHIDDYLAAKAVGVPFVGVVSGATKLGGFVEAGLSANNVMINLCELRRKVDKDSWLVLY